MPTKNKRLVSLDGTEQYERYLDRLIKKLRKEHGVQISEGDRLKLAEYALARLGFDLGILAPRRTKPVGTNRHGEPKDKAAIE